MDFDFPRKAASPQRSLLCLKCRHPGHRVADCSQQSWVSELYWTFSPLRKLFNASGHSYTSQSTLCERCRALNVPDLLNRDIEWYSNATLNDKASSKSSPQFRVLGKTGSIEFWSNCPLCLCLFSLTPNPSSEDQEVIIFPHWTIFRLEGTVVLNTDEMCRYAKCLLVTLEPSTMALAFEDRVMRGDALCFVEDVSEGGTQVLGGREIQTDRVDTGRVQQWLKMCMDLHPLTCKPHWTTAIRIIRLIDVDSRKIVQYPDQPCEYIALSYVWGNVGKQSFKLGSELPKEPAKLSQTIEDAITLVGLLKKKYLWVDALCIDQLDEDDKNTQISIMGDIYRCAFATIVSLSGQSADDGLPRVGHNRDMVPQLRCNIDGHQMVGLMPTLSQMLWPSGSPWGRRAWTFQEALLSRRCIYLSNFQIYYECNAMQCCESLDEARSPIHQLYRNKDITMSFETVGAGCLRHFFSLPGVAAEPLLVPYSTRLTLYMYRTMSDHADAVHAFAGVIQDLEREHGTAFHYGLPVQTFQWGLLWTAQGGLKRRKPEDFPSWAWAGWVGAIWQLTPGDPGMPCQTSCWLTIHSINRDKHLLLFSSAPESSPEEISQIQFSSDPVAKLGVTHFDGADFDLQSFSNAGKDGYLLLVEGIVFRFNPRYNQVIGRGDDRSILRSWVSSFRMARLLLDGVVCAVHAIPTDAALAHRTSDIERDFLLVARDYKGGYVHHWLLLLEFREDGIAERAAVIGLSVPESYLKALWAAHPQKRKFLLG